MALFGIFGKKEQSKADLEGMGFDENGNRIVTSEQAAAPSQMSPEELMASTSEALSKSEALSSDQEAAKHVIGRIEQDDFINERQAALDSLQQKHPDRLTGFSEDEVSDEIAYKRLNASLPEVQSEVVEVSPQLVNDQVEVPHVEAEVSNEEADAVLSPISSEVTGENIVFVEPTQVGEVDQVESATVEFIGSDLPVESTEQVAGSQDSAESSAKNADNKAA